MKFTFPSLFKLTSAMLALVSVLIFNACEETTTPDDNCSLTMNSFNVNPKTFSGGATLTGTVSITETLNLSDATLKALTRFYLSTDNTYSNNDVQLTAFVATNGLVANGNQTTLTYDQIDIPNNATSGSYFILARIEERPCPEGGSTSVALRSVAVTIN